MIRVPDHGMPPERGDPLKNRSHLARCMLLAAVVFIAGCSAELPTRTEGHDELARSAIQDLMNEDREALLDKFCYPDATRADYERAWLRNAMTIVETEFGRPVRFEPHEGLPNAHFVAIGAGTEEYWARRQGAVRYGAKVEFSKKGRGWIQIDISQACGTPKIKVVQYALPMNEPGSMTFIGSVMSRLAETLSAEGQ